MSLRVPALALAGALCLAHAASAADLVVDAAGLAGPYTDITQAMLSSAPGDRILVMPGHYPAFQFSRGVHVIGLGDAPGDVHIDQVAYHISVPITGYDTLLSNVEIGPTNEVSFGYLAMSGNEAPPGVLVIDSVKLNGGLFLGGGNTGFLIVLSNTSIDADTGEGFANAAAYLGGPGNYVEIRNTRINGWDADAGAGIPAGSALLLRSGTEARIFQSVLEAGDGAAGGTPALAAGADAIVQGGGAGAVTLRLDGATLISGGAGATAAGGDGVQLASSGKLEVGDADVTGGAGTPAGAPSVGVLPAPTAADLRLHTTPALVNAEGESYAVSGDTVSWTLPTSTPQAAIALSFEVELPESVFVPLPSPQLLVLLTTDLSFQIPFVAGTAPVGLMVYAQGFIKDGGPVLVTNMSALRVDLLVAAPGA
jgi:hypothetical protein